MNAAIPEKGKTLTPEEIAISQAKNATIFSQDQVDYTTLSPNSAAACANCVFYRSTGYDGIDWPHCHLVEDWPKPIEPTGWCKRHEVMPEPAAYEPAPMPVYIVEPEFEDEDSAEMSLTVPKSMLEQVKEFIGNLGKPNKPQAFSVFKAANGKLAWVSRHTGKWIDRENEIIADLAHEKYVDRVQKGLVDPPELWMWHANGTKHGQAVTVWKSGGFVLAAGYFDDNEVGKSAFDFYQKNAGKIKLSHMFHYPSAAKIDGVYHEYNTIEITTLPDGAEAFPYTNFEEINTMALPDIAKDMIKTALGEDTLQRALAADSKAAADSKTLDAQGIASKNLDQYPGSEVLEAARTIQGFTPEFTALKTRLEAAEQSVKTITDLTAAVKSLQETVKALDDKLTASQSAETAALKTVADLQKDLAELKDLKPPASQSSETLLNDREKSLVDSVIQAAKSADQKSLVDTLVGGSPAIS